MTDCWVNCGILALWDGSLDTKINGKLFDNTCARDNKLKGNVKCDIDAASARLLHATKRGPPATELGSLAIKKDTKHGYNINNNIVMMSRIRSEFSLKYPSLIELNDCIPKNGDYFEGGIKPLTITAKWDIPMHVPALETLNGDKYTPKWTDYRNAAIKIDDSDDESNDNETNKNNICNGDKDGERSVEIVMTSQGAGEDNHDDDKNNKNNSGQFFVCECACSYLLTT